MASASSIAWVCGTSGSFVPWKVRIGASSLVTYVRGEALAASSGLSVGRRAQEVA